jgi:hypothetical protein
MKFEDVEFLRKQCEKAFFGLIPKSKSNDQATVMAEDVAAIKEGLMSMASMFTYALKAIEDDMKVKDNPVLRPSEPKEEEPWKQEFKLEYDKAVEIAKGKDWQHAMFQQYGLREGKPPAGNEAWVIPFCIEELLRINKKLREYTPSNPELAELTIQEIVCKLSIEMQMQNNVLMTALRHLMGKTEKTKIEESELR